MSKRLSFSIAINLLTENFKKGANTVKNAFKSMQMQILTFAAALGVGGLGLAGLLSRFKDVARETSRVTTALKNVSIGTGGFADNMRFVYDLAKEYGLEINALISNFAKFTASATQANMPMEDQKKIFESLSKASTAFALSSEQTDGVFLALTQMMSKGKISMEELRNQMGEKLPVAMAAMAKALGVSIAEMDKLVSRGKVMSADVLPKFADALSNMIPDVDTNNLEASLNKLNNAFGEIVDSSGFANKYKALIDGLTSAIKLAGDNIKNIVVGIAAVIAFVATNASSKVLKSWWQVADDLTIGQRKLKAEVLKTELEMNAAAKASTAARVNYENSVGKAKIAAYNKAVLAQNKYHAAIEAADKADLAYTTAMSSKKAGVVTKGLNTIKIGVAKLWVSLKSLWTSFAPAIIISALVAIGGYFKNLYDEAKRIKNIFSEYKKEANSAGNTQEVVMLQKQLSIMNDKTKSQKEVNAAQEVLQKMLGKEKLSQEEINKQINKRIELLKEAARADYYAQKVVSTENTIKELASSVGLKEDQVKKLAKTRSDLGNGSSFDIANKSRKITGDNNYYQQIGAAYRENGVKGAYDLSSADDAVKQIVEHLRVLDDANTELGDAVNKSNTLTTNMPTTPNDPDKKKDNRQKVIDDELKYQNAKARAELVARNRELENQQALLDMEQDGFDKQQKQIDLNHKKEILGIDTRTQDLIEKQQDAERQLWDIEHPDASKTKELFKTTTNAYTDLSDTNKSELITSDDIATRQREKAESDLLKNLLEKYQNYNTQRTKLEKDYSEEISFLESRRNETNSKGIDAAIAELQKQKQKAVSSINLEEFQDSIDWNTVFGNLDRVSTNALQGVREKLKNYLIEAGNSLAPTDLKTITDAIEQMNLEIADREPINELKSSYEGYKNALVEVIAAKEKLKGLEEGTSEYIKATKELSDAEKKRRASLTVMSQSVNSFGQKGNQLISSGNEIIDMLGAFGVEVDENVAKTLAGVGQIMSGLQNIDLNKPFSIVTSSITMLTGAGKAIAGVFGLFGGGDNNRYLKMKEQYESLNKVWDELITKKKEYISTSYGEEARKVGEEAKRLTEKQVESNRELGKAYMNSFKNKTGSSWGVRQQSRIKGNDWQDLDTWKNLNKISDDLFNSVTTGRMTGLFDLTAEQLESLKEEAPSLWAKLEDQTKEYLNNIIDGGERLEDINKSLKEQYTQLSLDFFKDSYVDMLSDMDSSNQDLADNFEKYIQKAILSSLIGTKYKKQIESLYDDFANANSDGNIDVSEAAALKKKQEELAAQMLAERDKLKETFGWESDSSKSQDSSKGYSVSMDQDTGGAILGRVTGLHETGLRMEAFLKNISLDTSNYLSQSVSIANELKKQTDILNDSFQIHKKSYFKIESISEGMEVLGDVKDRLAQIEKNTKGLVSK